jgi:hypothetical protein
VVAAEPDDEATSSAAARAARKTPLPLTRQRVPGGCEEIASVGHDQSPGRIPSSFPSAGSTRSRRMQQANRSGGLGCCQSSVSPRSPRSSQSMPTWTGRGSCTTRRRRPPQSRTISTFCCVAASELASRPLLTSTARLHSRASPRFIVSLRSSRAYRSACRATRARRLRAATPRTRGSAACRRTRA